MVTDMGKKAREYAAQKAARERALALREAEEREAAWRAKWEAFDAAQWRAMVGAGYDPPDGLHAPAVGRRRRPSRGATARQERAWARLSHLRVLAAVGRRRARLEVQERDAVAAARSDGVTWADIALALGVKPDAARKRYGGQPHA